MVKVSMQEGILFVIALRDGGFLKKAFTTFMPVNLKKVLAFVNPCSLSQCYYEQDTSLHTNLNHLRIPWSVSFIDYECSIKCLSRKASTIFYRNL